MRGRSPGAVRERSELCESVAEEAANAVSHGIGAICSVVALGVMVAIAAPLSPWHLAGATVFGVSLFLLYLASTIYHLVTTHRRKRFFRVVDHALIFVLIAGTYTPWLLVNLRGPWGWSLLGVVWGLALAGILIKAFLLPRFDKAGTILYLVMGWLICVAIKPLLENINAAGLLWLVLGGLFYTVGVAFYLAKNLRFGHVVWHFFVLAGSLCHVLAVIHGVLLFEGANSQ